ncbi:hypothetical protein [Flavobacterium sp. H4147]|uniref:hypothetical protein n=1 Tax=Flavobacterium sp. H4147 TaxID=3034149 RepID=UPI0023EBE518|nr:hypothetical protein [Flavobacterium sp. H4147]
MDLQTEIENCIKKLFSIGTSSVYTLPTNKGNLYELYLYLLIFETLKNVSGNNATIINPNGSSTFKFRTSPGIVKNSKFSYAVILKGSKKFELRNGIEIIGININHEMDILLLENQQIDNVRPNKLKGELVFALECKNHSALSSLKGEVRKFLGAITDLTSFDHNLAGCIHCGIGFKPYFTTPLNNSHANNSLMNYANNYGLNPKFNLYPGSIEESNFIGEIQTLYNLL